MIPACIFTQRYQPPCGELLLGIHTDRLCLCDWTAGKHHPRIITRLQRALNAHVAEGDTPMLQQAIRELDAYFSGKKHPFKTPLLLPGSKFQKRVWQRLLLIPGGQTLSYGELARALGVPSAVRAVANAFGANALSIFVPCHRVIGSHGDTGGYAGGLDAKSYLLTLEQQYTPQAYFSPLFT